MIVAFVAFCRASALLRCEYAALQRAPIPRTRRRAMC
jgi:hypothetical protein